MLTPIYDALFDKSPKENPVPASVFFNVGGYEIFGTSPAGYKVQAVSLDLIISESHALTSTVSSHPVEDGAAVSDHIKNELRMGSLTGLVSNHSLNRAPEYEIAEAGASTKRPNYGTSLKPWEENPAQAAWDQMKEQWKKRRLVTIVTALEVYKDVAITNVQTTRTSESGEALEFSISFQQVKKVKLQEVEISASVAPLSMKTDTDKQASVKKNKGQEVAKKVSTTDDGPYTSYINDNNLVSQ